MKLKATLTAIIGSLALNIASHAAPVKPDVCPSAAAIKSQGLAIAYNFLFNYYGTFQYSQYDTSQSWLFGLGLVEAQNDEDALVQGNALLTSLSGNPEPVEVEQDSWACVYDLADDDYLAIAYQTDYFASPAKLGRFFKAPR